MFSVSAAGVLSGAEFERMHQQLAELQDHTEMALKHLEGNFSGVWAQYAGAPPPADRPEVCVTVATAHGRDNYARTSTFLAAFGASVTRSMNVVAQHGVDMLRMHTQLAACVPPVRHTGEDETERGRESSRAVGEKTRKRKGGAQPGASAVQEGADRATE